MINEDDLLSRVSVYNMLDGLGGTDASDSWSGGWDSAINTAIVKLDSVQPAIEGDSEDFISAWELSQAKKPKEIDSYLTCPNCEQAAIANPYVKGKSGYPHCPWCGQKLDWSE